MAGFATSLEELKQLIIAPQKIIAEHVAAVKQSGGQPVQMPQVVVKPPVVQPIQHTVTRQQPTVSNPTVVPPKKGGCGCWGKK